jgi:Phytanoyl-CoA dioxygenase (PhyH)
LAATSRATSNLAQVRLNTCLAQAGYAILPAVLTDHGIAKLGREIADLDVARAGKRSLLNFRWCLELAERICTDSRFQQILDQGSQAIECTLFVKSAEMNWLVALHQDLSIPVAARIENPEWTGWSYKEGRLFAQPPVAVLEELVAIRLHLDDCDESNGALRVVPGSHRFGRLCPNAAVRKRDCLGEQIVPVARGGAMVMKPMLLHASSKSVSGALRRVLQFVFAPPLLAQNLSPATRRRGSGESTRRIRCCPVNE